MTVATLIVGGGISGLSVAWFLHRRGVPVRVLEADGRTGGLIATERGDGWLVERGPNSTLQKPARPEDALGRLVDGLGLSARLLEAGRAGARRYVMRGGGLMALPGSPPAMLATGLFSLRAKLRLLAEPFIGRAGHEETIAAFVERRLGREFLDYAVEPFVSGVYAGDPRSLSVRAAVPRIHRLEVEYGSLIRGAIALGKAAKGAGMPAGRLISFDRGMAALPEAIATALPPGSVRLGCRATSLRITAEGWEVGCEGPSGPAPERAERLILATPAGAAAALLEPLAPEAAALLRGIAYAPIVSAGLGYPRAAVGHPLDGFGFLVPRREGVRILGGLFSSTLFPDRAPPGQVLVTAFAGGATDPTVAEMEDRNLTALLHGDLARTLAIGAAPAPVHLFRHASAIPQYVLGHLERVDAIDRALTALPRLHLRASWRDGVSVADCIRNGEDLAMTIPSNQE